MSLIMLTLDRDRNAASRAASVPNPATPQSKQQPDPQEATPCNTNHDTNAFTHKYMYLHAFMNVADNCLLLLRNQCRRVPFSPPMLMLLLRLPESQLSMWMVARTLILGMHRTHFELDRRTHTTVQ